MHRLVSCSLVSYMAEHSDFNKSSTLHCTNYRSRREGRKGYHADIFVEKVFLHFCYLQWFWDGNAVNIIDTEALLALDNWIKRQVWSRWDVCVDGWMVHPPLRLQNSISRCQLLGHKRLVRTFICYINTGPDSKATFLKRFPSVKSNWL